jgi:hypothetical protein
MMTLDVLVQKVGADAASTPTYKTGYDMMNFGTHIAKLFRRNDPQTSFDAAEKVDTTKLEKMVYEAIKSFGDNGCISDQVLELFPTLPYSSVTARYKALLEKDYIEIEGTRVGRSGRQQRVMKCK